MYKLKAFHTTSLSSKSIKERAILMGANSLLTGNRRSEKFIIKFIDFTIVSKLFLKTKHLSNFFKKIDIASLSSSTKHKINT